VLIFARTKHRARLGEQLEAGYHSVTSLQGNHRRTAGRPLMTASATAEFQILVAADILARGIDVTRISHVTNYDIPIQQIHFYRIGRAGRAAQNRRCPCSSAKRRGDGEVYRAGAGRKVKRHVSKASTTKPG